MNSAEAVKRLEDVLTLGQHECDQISDLITTQQARIVTLEKAFATPTGMSMSPEGVQAVREEERKIIAARAREAYRSAVNFVHRLELGSL
jgi:hypothetical protein